MGPLKPGKRTAILRLDDNTPFTIPLPWRRRNALIAHGFAFFAECVPEASLALSASALS
jgi:hypothetical protein